MKKIAIINDTSSTHHYGCLMVMKNLKQLLNEEGAEIIWTWPVSVDWRKHKNKILTFPHADIIIVNGEGTIHHGPKRWQADALADFGDFAKNTLKTPCFLINATLYANEDSLVNKLKSYEEIFVRDRPSHEYLNEKNISNHLVADMTFSISSGLTHSPHKALCVVDSVMQSDLPKLKELSKKHKADYCSMIVARPSNYSPWKKTRRFILETFKWFFYERERSLDPVDFEAYIGQYKLIVTGRYHTVTMCLKNRIPFIALESNTPKISFLLNEVFGTSNRVIRPNKLNHLDISKWSHFSKEENVLIDDFLDKATNSNRLMISGILKNKQDLQVC